MGPEGPSGQCHLPLPVASYNPACRAMFNEMTAVINFSLCHTTLVAFDIFLRLSLMLHKYGLADLTKRGTWWKFKKTASLSGAADAAVTITIPTLGVHAVPLMTLFFSNLGNRGMSSRYLELSVLGDLILLQSICRFCICMYNLCLGWFYSRQTLLLVRL